MSTIQEYEDNSVHFSTQGTQRFFQVELTETECVFIVVTEEDGVTDVAAFRRDEYGHQVRGTYRFWQNEMPSFAMIMEAVGA